MMNPENRDVHEVTCVDCGITKAYFSPEGVNFFKMSHKGHDVREKGEGATQEAQPRSEPPKPVSRPAAPEPEPQKVLAPARQAPQERDPEAAMVTRGDPVRLNNLVVDVVDEEGGRKVAVYGIANGRERFSKGFEMRTLSGLNLFLEAGSFSDPSTSTTYIWTPDKIDLSSDVAKILDEAGLETSEQQATPEPETAGKPEPKPEQPAEKVPREEPAKQKKEEVRIIPAPSQPLPEGVLLGKLSYIQPGDEYRLESLRVSKVLQKFRWNTELPYVIGAMFDNLLSVQSQTGTVRASVIEAVSKIGYTFVALEAPSGKVTVWFRRVEAEPGAEKVAEPVDVPIEFGR